MNGTEIYKFKAKDSKIVATPLCLGNISKDWSTDNMKKTGFNGYVYDFSVDYDATDVDDIVDIHRYLMKKNKIGYMKIFKFVKKVFFVGLTILSGFASVNSLNAIPLSCISMNNQECKTRPQVVNVIGGEPLFFPFSTETTTGSGSFNINIIKYPYAKICVPDVVKNVNVKVLNLMSRTNKTRHIEWHETSKCKCKFGANICNNKPR